MWSTVRTVAITGLAALAFLIPTDTAFAPHGSGRSVVPWTANNCSHGHGLKSALRGAYGANRTPWRDRARSRHYRLCVRSEAIQSAVTKAIRRHLRWRVRHAPRLRYKRFEARLPYDCGSAGRFAIPCYIVACESHYSWTAYNSSSAAGPYQIMGEWGRPWPVSTWAHRMSHHIIAAQIWRGGAGASNWVCA